MIRALLLFSLAGGASAQQATSPLMPFQLVDAVNLAGNSPEWDYLAWDKAHARLFIGRRGGGLAVYDPATRRVVATIADSAGAGAATLVPALDRSFSVNEDGSMTVFVLSTLKTIRRVKIAEDADSAVFEPATGQLLLLSGDSKRITFVDAKTLAVRSTLATASAKLEASAADGNGRVFIAERDRNAVVVIDARTRSVVAEWPLAGCNQPTGLALDEVKHRLFAGCRGDHPVLAVIDAITGRVIGTPDLGRGNDGVVWDAASGRVFTANGVDANVVVYRATINGVAFDHAFTTRPGARTLAYDAVHERLFTATAEGVVDPSRPINRGPSAFYPNVFQDSSFTVLTYEAGRVNHNTEASH